MLAKHFRLQREYYSHTQQIQFHLCNKYKFTLQQILYHKYKIVQLLKGHGRMRTRFCGHTRGNSCYPPQDGFWNNMKSELNVEDNHEDGIRGLQRLQEDMWWGHVFVGTPEATPATLLRIVHFLGWLMWVDSSKASSWAKSRSEVLLDWDSEGLPSSGTSILLGGSLLNERE